MSALREERTTEITENEIIDTVVNTINARLSQTNTSLKQLAEITKIDYNSLRNIVNKRSVPTLRVLSKLANSLELYPHELLSVHNNPQQIPLIDKNEIKDFNPDNTYNCYIRNNEYIHPFAFAICEKNIDFIIPSEITYICYKSESTIFHPQQVYVVSINHKIKIIKINKISHGKIYYTCNNQENNIVDNDLIYLGTVVSMNMSEKIL